MPRLPRAARSRAAILALTVASTLPLAACAADDGVSPGAGSPSPTSSDAFPVTVDNCGFEVTVEEAPERIVTIKSSTTEMLLALGLADRLVGAAFLDGPIAPEYGASAAGLPILSDRVPGQEALLSTGAELVYAGWESNFSPDGAGDRASLTALGVATYVSPSACKAPGYQPDPLTFEEVFAEITEAGRVLGVPDAAAELVAEQRADLAEVTPDTSGRTALWYSSGADIPYVGAGIGAPQMIMDAVGLTNVAADVHDTWTPMGWEEIVEADPDVIVLVDAAWNTAESKIELLEANPATAQLSAVREGRYLEIAFPATEAGVRNVAAARDLADQLAALTAGS
jgi:iron complex transport system substrate-binding protein